jgi:hypothetical protein
MLCSYEHTGTTRGVRRSPDPAHRRRVGLIQQSPDMGVVFVKWACGMVSAVGVECWGPWGPTGCRAPRFRSEGLAVAGVSGRVDALVSLICAGWLPHDAVSVQDRVV